MRLLTRFRPSPALVVALLALFVALAGTGYAVSTLPENSVGSPQVIDHSLARKDFKQGVLRRGRRGVRGLRGHKGDKGDKGDTGTAGTGGTPGSPGVSGYELVTATSAVDSTSPKNFSAECPVGKKVLGGGSASNNSGFDIVELYSYPATNLGAGGNQNGWTTGYKEDTPTAGNWFVFVYAICGNVT